MDVEIQEELLGGSDDGSEMNIYDLEAYIQKNMNFPKHNRFYQAKIDGRLMQSGEKDFSKIHDYVEKVKVAPEVKETYMKFEEIMQYNREQGEQIGIAKGELTAKRQAILDVLEIYGTIPEDLRKRIESENDLLKLTDWHILAVKSGSIEGFQKRCLLEYEEEI